MSLLSTACLRLRSPPLRLSERLRRRATCFQLGPAALMPPPARVTLISPDDPESLALLRWVEAEDPALTTTTQRLPEAKSLVLPPIQHRPSYASHQPKLKALPPLL